MCVPWQLQLLGTAASFLAVVGVAFAPSTMRSRYPLRSSSSRGVLLFLFESLFVPLSFSPSITFLCVCVCLIVAFSTCATLLPPSRPHSQAPGALLATGTHTQTHNQECFDGIFPSAGGASCYRSRAPRLYASNTIYFPQASL